MRRPTSRGDASEAAEFGQGVVSASSASDMESQPTSSAARRGSFLGVLATHALFSLVLVAMVVLGLRWERRSSPAPPQVGARKHSVQAPARLSEDELEAAVNRRRTEVASLRRSGIVMETDPRAQEPTAALRNATRRLLALRYGPGPTYRVALRLQFPASMGGELATVVVETAPIDLLPHAVHVFLDACVTKRLQPGEPWAAAFHRNANHVLQAFVRGTNLGNLAYQEYDARFPHRKYTLGFAGRPGGPEFYISTVDNSKNHGPGSQGSETEADACFAKVVEGVEIVEKMRQQPAPPGLGFVRDKQDFIRILGVDLLD